MNANQALASVLNGNRSRWTNGPVSVRYRAGTWTWITPDGVGTTEDYADVLEAVAPYLNLAA